MIRVPKTESSLTVSIKRDRALELIAAYDAPEVPAVRSDASIYDVGDCKLMLVGDTYSAVFGPEEKVLAVLGG